MKRITLLALGFLSLGLVTSASAQTKVTQLIIQNGNGTTKLSQISGGLTVDNYLILQRPGDANSKITLNVPNTGSNSNFYFPAVGGTLLTGATDPTNGDAMIAAINMGTTQINEARVNLSNYVTNGSLATTLLNYVTNSSLATTLGGYVTNTYLTSNYTTTTDMNTAITNAVTTGLPTVNATPGSYTNANITVDAQGRVTLASNGSSSGGSATLPKSTVSMNNNNNNDLAVGTNRFFRLTSSTDFGVRSIETGTDGTMIVLYNSSSSVMTIVNNGGAPSGKKRILTNTGSDIVTSGTGAATLIYDSAADSGNGAWILLSSAL